MQCRRRRPQDSEVRNFRPREGATSARTVAVKISASRKIDARQAVKNGASWAAQIDANQAVEDGTGSKIGTNEAGKISGS